MTIKDMELQTGLARANIRYYEAEGLISPERAENGYREYLKAPSELMDVVEEGTLLIVVDTHSKTIIEYIDKKVNNVDFSAAIATAKQEAITAAATDATTKAGQALTDAKAYADGLAKNYATAAQGKKADDALQKADIETGATNGSISVKGTDVPIKGLGSAAFTPATDYEKAGAVAALEAGQVATNKTNIATNASDITAAKARIQALEDVKYTAITNEEIDGYFAAKKE